MLEFAYRRHRFQQRYFHSLISVSVIGRRAVVRRLGDAAVVFDSMSWETHLLPPELALVASIAESLAIDGPVTGRRLLRALEDEAGEAGVCDYDALVSALERIGVVEA